MPRLADVLLPVLEEGRAATRRELDDIKDAILELEAASGAEDALPRFGRVYFDKLGMHIRVGTDARRPEIQFIAGGKGALDTARFAGWAGSSTRSSPYVTANAYFDGSDWNIDDTNRTGTIFSLTTSGNIVAQLRYVTAGANPRGTGANIVKLLDFYAPTNPAIVFNEGGADIDHRIEGANVDDVFKVDAGLDQVLAGTTIAIKERADQQADITGYGQLWVKNTTPCQLWFTSDDGTDTQLA